MSRIGPTGAPGATGCLPGTRPKLRESFLSKPQGGFIQKPRVGEAPRVGAHGKHTPKNPNGVLYFLVKPRGVYVVGCWLFY